MFCIKLYSSVIIFLNLRIGHVCLICLVCIIEQQRKKKKNLPGGDRILEAKNITSREGTSYYVHLFFGFLKNIGRQKIWLCQFLTDRVINSFSVLEYKAMSECCLRNEKKVDKRHLEERKWFLICTSTLRNQKLWLKNTGPEGNFIRAYKLRL